MPRSEKEKDKENQWCTKIKSEAEVGTKKVRVTKRGTEKTELETQRGAKTERTQRWKMDDTERLAKTQPGSRRGDKVKSEGRGAGVGCGQSVTGSEDHRCRRDKTCRCTDMKSPTFLTSQPSHACITLSLLLQSNPSQWDLPLLISPSLACVLNCFLFKCNPPRRF